MSEFGVGFNLYANASKFTAGLREAGEASKGLKRTLGDTFGESSIWKNLTAIGALTTMQRALMIAIDNAQQLRDEADKLGKPIDAATRSVAGLGDGMDGLVKVGKNTLTWLVSGYTQLGEVIGDAANKAVDLWTGTSQKVRYEVENTANAAIQAEKNLAKAREDNSPEKLAAAEKKLADARRESSMKQADDMGKVFILYQQQLEIEKEMAKYGINTVKRKELEAERQKVIGDLAEAAAKSREVTSKAEEEASKAEELAAGRIIDARVKLNKLKFDALPVAEKERILQGEIQTIQDSIRHAKQAGEESTEMEIALIERTNELLKVQEKTTSDIADNFDDMAMSVEEIIKNQKENEAASWLGGGIGSSRGGAQFNDASDATLKSIIAKNRQQALDITNPAIVGSQTQARLNSWEASRLNIEAQNAQQVLDTRESLRRNVSMGGVDYARSQYKGDPLSFDQMMQRWVTDARTTVEIQKDANQLLKDLNDRLLKAGFGK